MCHAFKGLTLGTTKVVSEIGCQSRKIVNKRFGEDYVKTFLPAQETENKENVETPITPLREKDSEQENRPLLESSLQ